MQDQQLELRRARRKLQPEIIQGVFVGPSLSSLDHSVRLVIVSESSSTRGSCGAKNAWRHARQDTPHPWISHERQQTAKELSRVNPRVVCETRVLKLGRVGTTVSFEPTPRRYKHEGLTLTERLPIEQTRRGTRLLSPARKSGRCRGPRGRLGTRPPRGGHCRARKRGRHPRSCRADGRS
jgi:hypothetical protein